MRRHLPSGTVTFLFTDIEGSTRLLHALGAPAYAEALESHRRIVRKALADHGGVEIDTQGDGFFAVFPTAPGALEAAAAISTGLEGEPTRVRIGLHTGTPLLHKGEYVGEDVHRAARIAGSGHGGQVLLSSVTASLLPVGRLRDLGVHRLKDISAPERIYQLGDATFPPLNTPSHSNLPVPATPFLGRELELGDLLSLLSQDHVRLLTLTGPGGAGKSRLALEAAARCSDQFPWGAWFVQLAAASAADVSSALAETVGIEPQPDRPLVETLVTRLREREMLIVLDNCEHVLEAAGETASAILEECPTLRIVATSRQRLGLAGEQVWIVKPLSHPTVSTEVDRPAALLEYDAIRLFVERAHQANGDWKLDVSAAPHVVRICAALEGLPLAIELAAARTRVLTVAEIADRLNEQLALLGSSTSEQDAHGNRPLRATIDWSYGLMSEDERRLFRRLSAFSGGANFAAVEATCADVVDSPVLDVLDSLVSKSMLLATEVGRTMRYRPLEPLRQYAASRLAEHGEEEDAFARHWAWFEELARHVERGVRGPDQLEWLARTELDYDNMRVALQRAYGADRIETCFSLAGSLSWFMFLHSHVEDWDRWLPRLLEHADRADSPMLFRLLLSASQYAWELSRLEAAEAHALRALEVAETMGSDTMRAWSHAYLALIGVLGRRTSGIEGHLDDAEDLFQARGTTAGVGFVMWLRVLSALLRLDGGTAMPTDDPDRLWETIRTLVDGARHLGDRNLLGHTLWTGAEVASLRGDLATARAHAAEGTRALYELGNQYCLAHNLLGAARVAMLCDEPVEAATMLAGAYGLRERLGVPGSPLDLEYSERLLDDLRHVLEGPTLDAAWADGSHLPVSSVVELAGG